ncbi:DUF742 domain-containing protein [Streptomyces sviceus]|uniref:DUF742 domain-containing protein n=1 Tax=Streptomyces sviceus TaxID=285530 RepID=UPI0036918ED9
MKAPRQGGDRLVRTYVVTGGRSSPSRNHFDHILLISLSPSAVHLSRGDLNHEHNAILDILARSAQSVAELSALLRLPLSVIRILLADLMESGHITTGRSILDAPDDVPDREMLEAVHDGLRRL